MPEVEPRYAHAPGRRRDHELRRRKGSALAHVLLVRRDDHAALLADDHEHARVREHLDEPVRDLLAVVAARERIAGEALEGHDRREALADELLQQRLELRAALPRVELERPRADEPPDGMVGPRLVDPAEA